MNRENIDYSKTLNLPHTKFPMKANLPQKEEEILKNWEKAKIYEKLEEIKKDTKPYTLHDGPPYANGPIHMGHALNKVLKDFVVRYKNMTGYKALFVPGWDTHGLPTELKALNKVKSAGSISAPKLRNICKDFAEKYIKEQKKGFKRLGVLADWENPYITLKPEFEGAELEVFAKMVSKGCIYRGLRPVYWCSSCKTALAEAEIEYQKDECKSIYVKFSVKEDNGIFSDLGIEKTKINFVIWTTTTWTLPANMAVCLNKNFTYSLIKSNSEYYVVAKELLSKVAKAVNLKDYATVSEFKGGDLENIVLSHPFLNKESLVILGDHVTLESGTGCVHTAPGHGLEDFAVCQNYPELKKDISVAVDHEGKMTKICGKFFGLKIEEANTEIFKTLEENGKLLGFKVYSHSYPHCWRCKKPVIFRATKQWFCSIESFKNDAIKESAKVNWIPNWGKDRIKNMIIERKDWCISRQRKWGVPIPAFYCTNCGKELLNENVINYVSELFKQYGSNIWYEKEEKELLPNNTKCVHCGSVEFKKETDILDVWFDSGTSHTAVCKLRKETTFPADLYLEGADQFRGWFQSSLLTSVAANGIAPYKAVVTHGWVVDGEGKKQSKSLGNGTSPEEVIKTYGADILRLWVSSQDYHADVRLSDYILKQISEGYRKIRNTARYILGNLFDFNITTDCVDVTELSDFDKWILFKLNNVITDCLTGYEDFEFNRVYRSIYTFCVVDLSNYYLDAIKDRLYVQGKNSKNRKSAQTTIYYILDSLVKLLSPILPFTCSEIWKYMAENKLVEEENVLFSKMPKKINLNLPSKFKTLWKKIDLIRESTVKELEKAREQKIIGSSLEAKVLINFKKAEDYDLLIDLKDNLLEVLIVSDICIALDNNATKNIKIAVEKAVGKKCNRCWCYSTEISDEKKICKKCNDVLKKL